MLMFLFVAWLIAVTSLFALWCAFPRAVEWFCWFGMKVAGYLFLTAILIIIYSMIFGW